MKRIFLEKSKATEVLLALLKRPQHITELQREVKGSLSTIEARVEELIEHGLITAEEMEEWPFRRVLKLTERGLQMARFLDRLRNILREGLPNRREKWILALLHALGRIKGSTKLVKLLFLLGAEGKSLKPFYEFNLYKYGPYSNEIIRDARELENLGLIKIEEEIFEVAAQDLEDYKIRFSYDLTEIGREIAQSIFEELPEETKRAILSLRKYNRAPLDMLLQYVYSKYQTIS
ncbi:MAG: winged helix-turn-helix transcriptional regulator [Candidatus Bathyarchaeia archaeon]|nr:winged helix-turn-helix transcriptional regulator [Candidatus Bathyarchaeia archaeon]